MQKVLAAMVVVGILATLPESSVRAGLTFVRGDANGDGELRVSDAIVSLNYLFTGGPVPNCLEAGEWNGNGQLDPRAEHFYPGTFSLWVLTSGPPLAVAMAGEFWKINKGMSKGKAMK